MTRPWWFARSHGFDLLIVVAAIEGALEVVSGQDGTALWFAAPAVAIVVLPLLGRRQFPFAAPAALWVLAGAVSFVDGSLAVDHGVELDRRSYRAQRPPRSFDALVQHRTAGSGITARRSRVRYLSEPRPANDPRDSSFEAHPTLPQRAGRVSNVAHCSTRRATSSGGPGRRLPKRRS